MSGTKKNPRPHLPSLKISGFRGINSLSIPHLGHVTLLAGRNGTGKTTVLEAIQVYAARARQNVLRELLNRRKEFEEIVSGEESLPARMFEYANLFHGRVAGPSSTISIGSGRGKGTLKIMDYPWNKHSEEDRKWLMYQYDKVDFPESYQLQLLKVVFEGKGFMLPSASTRAHYPGRWTQIFDESKWPSDVKCVPVGPELLNDDEMISYWDNVVLTEDEGLCLQSLRSILHEKDYVEGITAIGDLKHSRRMIVRLKGSGRRVPLASLGDGAARMFGIAVALSNSRDGFLLIDEAENGIHHSQQEDYWYMILEFALKGNVQVFATTHSWDCVRGFARAAARSEAEGILVRLEREEDKIGVVEYSEEGIGIVTKHGIEVR